MRGHEPGRSSMHRLSLPDFGQQGVYKKAVPLIVELVQQRLA
jgi:hypothetical protein